MDPTWLISALGTLLAPNFTTVRIDLLGQATPFIWVMHFEYVISATGHAGLCGT